MKNGFLEFLSMPTWLIAQGEIVPDGDAPQQAEAMSPLFQFISNPMNLILVSGILFIMLVLRPQQKQMKQLQKTLASLKKNDRVVTASGIHGTVVQVNAGEPVVTLRIDDNTGARMTINRDTITKILNPDNKD